MEGYSERYRYRRDGYPPMWGRDLNMLIMLKQAKDDGAPYVTMDFARRGGQGQRREKRLTVEMDLVFVSVDPHTGDRAYKITARGESVLRAYAKREPSPLCKHHGVPKVRNAEGWIRCPECRRELSRESQERRFTAHTDKPCTRCHSAPRAVSVNGMQYTMCADCRLEENRRKFKRNQRRRRERIASGEVILCHVCQKNPVSIGPKHISDTCKSCASKRERQYQRNRKLRIMRQAFKRQEGGD